MSEERFTLNVDDNGIILIPNSILKDGEELSEREVCGLLNEQQDLIDKLQRYNDVLHDENLFNTMKMLEFMKEKGVFDEFYERIKKEVFGDE